MGVLGNAEVQNNYNRTAEQLNNDNRTTTTDLQNM